MSGQIYYIGEKDCKKATCSQKQEFPEGPDPYCFIHSLENFLREERASDLAAVPQPNRSGDRDE